MVNINDTSFTVYDVQDYIKSKTNSFQMNKPLEVVNVNSLSFNNGTSRDYKHCSVIQHPETGEELRPVRGYIGFNELGSDRCYYAEFQDSKGKTYSYCFQFADYDSKTGRYYPEKSIEKQRKEDEKVLEETLANQSGMGM